MSLKVPSVGKLLTNFEFSCAKFYDSSILITILYNEANDNHAAFDHLLVLRVCSNPNDDLDSLCESINHFIKVAIEITNKELEIRYDKNRSYFSFKGISDEFIHYKYTGQYYKGKLY